MFRGAMFLFLLFVSIKKFLGTTKLGALPSNAPVATGLAPLSDVSRNFLEGHLVTIIEIMSNEKEQGPKRLVPS